MSKYIFIISLLCLFFITEPIKAANKPSSTPIEKEIDLVTKELDQSKEGTPETKKKIKASPALFSSIGETQQYTLGEEDTLLDIARSYNLGYIEMLTANPEIDPWSPDPGTEIILPTQHLLPNAPQKGLVINLGEMRVYYFKSPDKAPISFPIGIGREGLSTPTGETTIVRKSKGPWWFPTDRMREENPNLPKVVKSGNANPLGSHAMYLGWPTFLIHGTNKPWGIGRRVSSGCIRMYPENILFLYKQVPTKTPVTVINEPVKMVWIEDKLYIEAQPSGTQSDEIEQKGKFTTIEYPEDFDLRLEKVAGDFFDKIDKKLVKKILDERRGIPILLFEK